MQSVQFSKLNVKRLTSLQLALERKAKGFSLKNKKTSGVGPRNCYQQCFKKLQLLTSL